MKPHAPFELSDPVSPIDHAAGPTHAPVIVVEYGDATHGGSHTMNIPGAVQQWLGARNVSGAIQHVFMAAHPHVDSGEHVLQRSDDWKRVEKVMGDANRPYDQHRYMPLKLTSLNDDGFTFAQIADVIEYFWDCI